ncbi:hypothetical protein QP185_20205 [Sphingomonas aerolata]|uniref:hypothetical protein n=1 Tax=Sphingomonas aerolata TaxID=185951 RepID=UPI002FE3E610
MEFVGCDVAEAVNDHAVLVDRIRQRAERGVDLVGLDTHQRKAGPLLRQVGVVREAAAEITVGDLPFVDPPHDELADTLEVFELSEGP